MEGCTAKLAFKKALRMWMQQRRGSADLVPLHEVCRFLAAHSDRYVEHGGQDRAVTFGVDPDFPKNETVLLWTDNTPAAVGYGRAVDALWDARAVQRKRPRRPTVDRDLVRESGKVFLVTARPEDDAIDGIELHSCHDATAGQLVGASTFDGVQQAISPLIAHSGTSLIALRVAVDEKHHLTCVYVFRKCLRHANAHAYAGSATNTLVTHRMAAAVATFVVDVGLVCDEDASEAEARAYAAAVTALGTDMVPQMPVNGRLAVPLSEAQREEIEGYRPYHPVRPLLDAEPTRWWGRWSGTGNTGTCRLSLPSALASPSTPERPPR